MNDEQWDKMLKNSIIINFKVIKNTEQNNNSINQKSKVLIIIIINIYLITFYSTLICNDKYQPWIGDMILCILHY